MVTATVVSCPPSPGGPGLAPCPFPARATVGSVALSEICRSGQSRCLSTPVLPAPRRAGRCAPSVGLALDFVLSRGAAHRLPRTDRCAAGRNAPRTPPEGRSESLFSSPSLHRARLSPPPGEASPNRGNTPARSTCGCLLDSVKSKFKKSYLRSPGNTYITYGLFSPLTHVESSHHPFHYHISNCLLQTDQKKWDSLT